MNYFLILFEMKDGFQGFNTSVSNMGDIYIYFFFQSQSESQKNVFLQKILR